MLYPIHTILIQGGKFAQFRDLEKFKADLAKHESEEIGVVLLPRNRDRSIEMNNYYRYVLKTVRNHYGKDVSVDAWHEYFKKMYLDKSKYDMIPVERGTPTTTKLNIPEFTQYLSEIMIWCLLNLGLELEGIDKVFITDDVLAN